MLFSTFKNGLMIYLIFQIFFKALISEYIHFCHQPQHKSSNTFIFADLYIYSEWKIIFARFDNNKSGHRKFLRQNNFCHLAELNLYIVLKASTKTKHIQFMQILRLILYVFPILRNDIVHSGQLKDSVCLFFKIKPRNAHFVLIQIRWYNMSVTHIFSF
jgi:hypothetical protein